MVDVLAAGDCVETWRALLEQPIYLPLGTTAHKQGRVAGSTAAGHDTAFAGSLGSQAVKLFDRVVARTGLRPDEAAAHGFDPHTVDITVDDHKAYYPGATPLRIRLTGDADGRLLGAQLLGQRDAEVAKRCDIIATAIHQRLTVGGSTRPRSDLHATAVGTVGSRPAGRPGVGNQPRQTPWRGAHIGPRAVTVDPAVTPQLRVGASPDATPLASEGAGQSPSTGWAWRTCSCHPALIRIHTSVIRYVVFRGRSPMRADWRYRLLTMAQAP